MFSFYWTVDIFFSRGIQVPPFLPLFTHIKGLSSPSFPPFKKESKEYSLFGMLKDAEVPRSPSFGFFSSVIGNFQGVHAVLFRKEMEIPQVPSGNNKEPRQVLRPCH